MCEDTFLTGVAAERTRRRPADGLGGGPDSRTGAGAEDRTGQDRTGQDSLQNCSVGPQVSRLYVLQDHPDILWCLDLNRLVTAGPRPVPLLAREVEIGSGNPKLTLCSVHMVTCSEDQTICVYSSTDLLKAAPTLETR